MIGENHILKKNRKQRISQYLKKLKSKYENHTK